MIFNFKKQITYLLILLFPLGTYAQLIPLYNSEYNRLIKPHLYCTESNFHSSVKPLYYSDYIEIFEKDSVFNPFKAGLCAEHSDSFGKNYFLQVLPVLSMISGIQPNFSFPYSLGGGVLLNAGINDKLGFSALVFHNYLKPLDYLIVSHENMTLLHSKGFLNGKVNYYNANYRFSLTYRPYDFLLFEYGFGNNFYGDGYRSLLLSDNSYNYPYFKLETKFSGIKYSVIWAQLKHVGNAEVQNWSSLKSKYAVFHYLDWKISSKLSIGLFESVIMHQDMGLNVNYFNPIIFFRPVEFYLGSHDNALMGLNLKLSVNSTNIFYSQLVIDDIIVNILMNDIRKRINSNFEGLYGVFSNKWGFQAGFKSFNLFTLKNLNAFTEFNITRPYLYSHRYPEQNYSHFGEALAHPLGANFREMIFGVEYHIKRFYFSYKSMRAKSGTDLAGTHYGQNIFLPTMDGNQGYPYVIQTYFNTILQGIELLQKTRCLQIEYNLDKVSFLSVNAGAVNRKLSKHSSSFRTTNHWYFYFGIKSDIGRTDHLF